MSHALARVFAAVVVGAGVSSCSAPVALVVVSPAWASLDVGQSVRLAATPQSARGRPLSDHLVRWSSEDTAVAIVDGTGRVTGLAPGQATITATSDGRRGSAAITVAGGDGRPDPPPPSECAPPTRRPAWIWCDDFEQDRLSRYFDYSDAEGSFVRVAGVGIGGSYGMRARWAVGQTQAGWLDLALGKTPARYFRPVDPGTAIYRDVYWRLYLRTQPGWVGGGFYKLTRAVSFTSAEWTEAMVAHLWGDPPAANTLQLDPVRGTDTSGTVLTAKYNDFAHFAWLGTAHGKTPIFDARHVGQWYCIEAHVRLNDAGQANGVFEYWINDSLEAQRIGLNFVGSFSTYGINAVFFENFHNDGSPAAQERYFDNVVISTERIGC